MGEDDFWGSFREELFYSSTCGTRVRCVQECEAEMKSTDVKHFFHANAVANSELIFGGIS